ncbi:MAG: hypothetical protein IPM71_00405 [Bacteroidota bacterium]|nr:MAG: hypothetical protein IPM71_00405 [Bacteroidota bacterium]
MDSRIDNLTSEERIELEKELRLNYITSATLFMMIIVLIQIFKLADSGLWNISALEILITFGLSLIVFVITHILTKQLRDDIHRGQKIIEFRIIENKFEYLDRQDRLSPEVKKYVVVADGEKYEISEKQYEVAEKTDLIAIHKTITREKRLKIEIQKTPAANSY